MPVPVAGAEMGADKGDAGSEGRAMEQGGSETTLSRSATSLSAMQVSPSHTSTLREPKRKWDLMQGSTGNPIELDLETNVGEGLASRCLLVTNGRAMLKPWTRHGTGGATVSSKAASLGTGKANDKELARVAQAARMPNKASQRALVASMAVATKASCKLWMALHLPAGILQRRFYPNLRRRLKEQDGCAHTAAFTDLAKIVVGHGRDVGFVTGCSVSVLQTCFPAPGKMPQHRTVTP